MALTKGKIIESIRLETGFTKIKSVQIIETLLEIMKRSLVSGDYVLISGFGKFHVNSKRQRKGRNPATGTAMMLEARKVVTFKCSNTLKKKINGNK
jgi:integration host factor subunit alpha